MEYIPCDVSPLSLSSQQDNGKIDVSYLKETSFAAYLWSSNLVSVPEHTLTTDKDHCDLYLCSNMLGFSKLFFLFEFEHHFLHFSSLSCRVTSATRKCQYNKSAQILFLHITFSLTRILLHAHYLNFKKGVRLFGNFKTRGKGQNESIIAAVPFGRNFIQHLIPLSSQLHFNTLSTNCQDE